MDAESSYLTTLESFNDGSRRNQQIKNPESHVIDLLIKTGHLHGTALQTSGSVTFHDVQITPSGTQLISSLKEQKYRSSWKGRITPPLLFFLGLAVSPVWDDFYDWRLKPLVTGVVPGEETRQKQQDPNGVRENR